MQPGPDGYGDEDNGRNDLDNEIVLLRNVAVSRHVLAGKCFKTGHLSCGFCYISGKKWRKLSDIAM
jgi:hypothetical protein